MMSFRSKSGFSSFSTKLGRPLLGGKVRVALDRDPRILDIRNDLGHRRGDIRCLLAAGSGGVGPGCRPLKDSPPNAAAAPQRHPSRSRGRTPPPPTIIIAACQAKHHGARGAIRNGVVIISLSCVVAIAIVSIIIIIDRHGPRGRRHKRHILF